MRQAEVKSPPTSIGEAFCFSSWKEELKSNVIETEAEDGTVLVRRRFTNQIRFASVAVNYKASLFNDFMTFWRITIRDGVDAFWVIEPSKTKTAWRATSAPSIQWLGAGAEAFQVSLTLMRDESWPT